MACLLFEMAPMGSLSAVLADFALVGGPLLEAGGAPMHPAVELEIFRQVLQGWRHCTSTGWSTNASPRVM